MLHHWCTMNVQLKPLWRACAFHVYGSSAQPPASEHRRLSASWSWYCSEGPWAASRSLARPDSFRRSCSQEAHCHDTCHDMACLKAVSSKKGALHSVGI